MRIFFHYLCIIYYTNIMNTHRKRMFRLFASVVLSILGFASCAHSGSVPKASSHDSDSTVTSHRVKDSIPAKESPSDKRKKVSSGPEDDLEGMTCVYGPPADEYDSVPPMLRKPK
jgi:hypothetical protein